MDELQGRSPCWGGGGGSGVHMAEETSDGEQDAGTSVHLAGAVASGVRPRPPALDRQSPDKVAACVI
jgi:hypothetical protein